jgi:hypothetical protein
MLPCHNAMHRSFEYAEAFLIDRIFFNSAAKARLLISSNSFQANSRSYIWPFISFRGNQWLSSTYGRIRTPSIDILVEVVTSGYLDPPDCPVTSRPNFSDVEKR